MMDENTKDTLRLFLLLIVCFGMLAVSVAAWQWSWNRELAEACLRDYREFKPRFDHTCTVEVRGRRFPATNLKIEP